MKKMRLPVYCGNGHFVGTITTDGDIDETGSEHTQSSDEEVVFDTHEVPSKAFVGGGNPRYSANYDKMVWN